MINYVFWQSSDEDSVPTPIVLIDQDSDSEATIVHLSFGDRLGALIDTVNWIATTNLLYLIYA